MRSVRVLVGASDLCLGAAEGRTAELIVLLLREIERINQRGVRKIVIEDHYGQLTLGMVTKTRLGQADCAGMEPE